MEVVSRQRSTSLDFFGASSGYNWSHVSPLTGCVFYPKIDPKRGPGRCCYQLGKLVFGIPVHILAEW